MLIDSNLYETNNYVKVRIWHIRIMKRFVLVMLILATQHTILLPNNIAE